MMRLSIASEHHLVGEVEMIDGMRKIVHSFASAATMRI
jgi:hypothetical protein